MKTLLRLGMIEFVFLLLAALSINPVLTIMDTTVFWRDLGAPPGKAMQILEADNESVRVQMDAGGQYYCRVRNGSECWFERDQSVFRYTANHDPRLKNYSEPPALSNV